MVQVASGSVRTQPALTATDRLLAKFEAADVGTEVLAEAARCLRLRCIRVDYLPGHCNIDLKLRKQTSISERGKVKALLEAEGG